MHEQGTIGIWCTHCGRKYLNWCTPFRPYSQWKCKGVFFVVDSWLYLVIDCSALTCEVLTLTADGSMYKQVVLYSCYKRLYINIVLVNSFKNSSKQLFIDMKSPITVLQSYDIIMSCDSCSHSDQNIWTNQKLTPHEHRASQSIFQASSWHFGIRPILARLVWLNLKKRL